jgi:transcriptional regulator with XRE-family HTH domain
MQQEASYGQIVGQVIRGRRELQGISLATMSQSLALASPSGWSRVETGDTAMTLSQLRRAARKLGMKPSEIVNQADLLTAQLEASGVVVCDEKSKSIGKWVLGGAGLLALIAGAGVAAAAASKADKTATKADDDSVEGDGEKEPS